MNIWVNDSRFCVVIETDARGIIVSAPPIVKWAKGKTADFFLAYLQNRGTLIESKNLEDKGREG